MRRRRKASGIRIERLAVAINRSAATVCFYETGRAVPPISIVTMLCDELGCTPADLFVKERQQAAQR
jgi:transcriptional regulator with XRE-family HTH domain